MVKGFDKFKQFFAPHSESFIVIGGRKRLLRLTSTHLKATEIQSSLMRIGEFMKRISAITEQLDFNRAWELIILVAF